MRLRELNGVKLGQRVQDLDGRDLGRVSRLYGWGFEVAKGFPILFRQDQVILYDEVRGERDGRLVVSRSEHQLLELASGEMPATWVVPAPVDFPQSATPGEARALFEALAAERAIEAAPHGPAPVEQVPVVSREEVAATEEDRRASVPAPPTAHP